MGGLNCQTGKDGSVSKQEFVLVVDEISDTADVLQAVLEPRGVAVNRVRKLSASSNTDFHGPPSVVVVDAESLNGTSPPSGQAWQNVPQVIIGTIRVADTDAGDDRHAHPPRRFLQKPFQFAELMKVIESLI